ncbi:MAG TPA: methyltransferase domain-containing protein [Symbiobacteriaceae bacterium]|nr:methyltransferase domain-containing protein [Symbiobacteriaceae bacterium]
MESHRLSGSSESNRTEFTRQAPTFAHSGVLGAPEQIEPVLEAAGIGPADRVVDVGCGTGFMLLGAARLARQVVGIDVTPAMLAEAKRRVDEAGLTNVTLREATAEALPFADQRFDVALTRLTLHHFGNPGRVLGEMHRVLRPGGRIVLCDITASEDPGKADLHNRLERLRDPSHVRHYPAGAIVKTMEGAGFTVTAHREWQTLRRFGEWTELASVRPEVLPALEAFLASLIPGNGGGIQAGRTADGELVFTHHWLVVAGIKG